MTSTTVAPVYEINYLRCTHYDRLI